MRPAAGIPWPPPLQTTFARQGSPQTGLVYEGINYSLTQWYDFYARYYTFEVTEARRVRIEMDGTLDNVPGGGTTALFLVSGSQQKGVVVAQSDPAVNASVEADLEAGTYTVEATTNFDDKGGTFTLKIIVLNQGPVFDDPEPVSRSVAENSAANTAVGTPVSATDPEGDAPLTYSFVTDADGKAQDADGSFAIDSTNGQISVDAGAVLDFEDTDNNLLLVTVGVSDGMTDENTADPDNTVDTTVDVTINLTDTNDPGVVSLSWPHAYLGYALEATLQDQDQVTASTESWQWQSADPSIRPNWHCQ